LANTIYDYIQPLYYPVPPKTVVSTQLQIEIKSVVYNIINAYNNQSLRGYNSEQMIILGMFLGPTTTDLTPINAIDTWFAGVENNISETGLSTDEQAPLLLTSEVAKTLYPYWVSKVAAPGKWSQFFQPQASFNYANIPFWTVAGIEGAAIGASASDKGLIAPTTDIVSVEIISALIGALAIGAGKIIFRWVPRIQPVQLFTETDNGTVIGGFSFAMDGGGGAASRVKNECAITNNCNAGNCHYACSVTR
jgi:hypothetical protein